MNLISFRQSLDFCKRFRYFLKESEENDLNRFERNGFQRMTVTDQLVLNQIIERLTKELA